MSERSVQHGTFTIEREFAFPPARVFAAASALLSAVLLRTGRQASAPETETALAAAD